jgi:hypothetical protein
VYVCVCVCVCVFDGTAGVFPVSPEGNISASVCYFCVLVERGTITTNGTLVDWFQPEKQGQKS